MLTGSHRHWRAAAAALAAAVLAAGCNADREVPHALVSTTRTAPRLPIRTSTPRHVRRDVAPRFTLTARRLTPSQRRRVIGMSWHEGCPVELDDLRYLRIGHWGFDRRRHLGEMTVAATSVEPLRRVFGELFRTRFPIRSMRLVDDYGGSDYASIQADNTSSFNCRSATGETRWSDHAYGRAVDVNPIENPYVFPDGTTVHDASQPFLDRARHGLGMSTPTGTLVRAFKRVGWKWGGDWQSPRAKDYQHFSSSGN